jgi:ABC-2 type transport system permease protein
VTGILLKTVRETWVVVLLFGLGLLLTERMLLFVLPQLQGQLDTLLGALPFVRTLFTALTGMDAGEQLGGPMLLSIVWLHPVGLSLVWACEIILCTRMPAGEVDRGTIDVLLGLPVSRRAVYCCETVVWIAGGAVVLAMGAAGYFLGARGLDPDQSPPASSTLLVLLNLACVYLAVGGMTLLVSSLSSRRARAMAVAFGIVLGSFLLNFLAQYWAPAGRIAFLGVLEYYQPARILQTGRLPLVDVAVLLGFATVTWAAAGEVVARRPLVTV